MPITSRIDALESIVRWDLSGVVRPGEFQSALEAMVADPAYVRGMPILADCLGLEPRFDVEDLREIAGIISTLQEKLGRCRGAAVLHSDVLFGLARMYEVFSQATSMEFRGFRDVGQALRWIRTGLEEARGAQ